MGRLNYQDAIELIGEENVKKLTDSGLAIVGAWHFKQILTAYEAFRLAVLDSTPKDCPVQYPILRGPDGLFSISDGDIKKDNSE